MKQSVFWSMMLLCSFMLMGRSAVAQGNELKLGYVNMDSVLGAMPETKVQQKTLESYAKQLKAQFAAKEKEMQTTYQGFIQKVQAGGVGPEEQQSMQAELQKMQGELEQMQGKAEADLMRKENELLQPLYEKIKKTIVEYAKANGFAYVFSSELLVASNPAQDITGNIISSLK